MIADVHISVIDDDFVWLQCSEQIVIYIFDILFQLRPALINFENGWSLVIFEIKEKVSYIVPNAKGSRNAGMELVEFDALLQVQNHCFKVFS